MMKSFQKPVKSSNLNYLNAIQQVCLHVCVCMGVFVCVCVYMRVTVREEEEIERESLRESKRARDKRECVCVSRCVAVYKFERWAEFIHYYEQNQECALWKIVKSLLTWLSHSLRSIVFKLFRGCSQRSMFGFPGSFRSFHKTRSIWYLTPNQIQLLTKAKRNGAG